jgi:hypothetical protein
VRIAGLTGDGAPWGVATVLYAGDSFTFKALSAYPGYLPGNVWASIDLGSSDTTDATGTFNYARVVARPNQSLPPHPPGFRLTNAAFSASRYTRQSQAISTTGHAGLLYEGVPFDGPQTGLLSWVAGGARLLGTGGTTAHFAVDNRTGIFTGSFQAPGLTYNNGAIGVFVQKMNAGFGFYTHQGSFGVVEIAGPAPSN